MNIVKIIFTAAIVITTQVNAQNSQEQNMSISIKGGIIEGTLTHTTQKEKLAIIIAGSGPTDRNGNNPMGVKANSYKMLAEELAKNNIASIRYDKRGIGKSKLIDNNESKMTFDDFIADAVSIYHYAKDSLGFSTIYFIGHSEGSLIGMVATQQTKANGFISLSGAGNSIDKVILTQVASQPPTIYDQIEDILNSLKKGELVDDVPQYLYSLFRPSVQPYMISWLKYNPVDEIKKLTVPTLIINGTCDVQVKPQEAELLHNANTKNQLIIINKMTHTLKDTSDDCDDASMKTYTDESLPLNKELVLAIVNFINQ
ncbi:MAG: alpha/beta hydrolase [Chitinophagaceae bacterium]|nr:alpha/beta hydrolase [Chitinophagaceae bacterium]MCW5903995.1 alpha/beta hydrolase [Chitinophagaceae bacterium]